MASQGGHANKTGNVLEQLVVATVGVHGFEQVPYRTYQKDPGKYGAELLLRNVPYGTLYNGRGYSEFVLISERFSLRTRIECKWQQKAGSTDEKLPYLYLSCIEAMPEDDVIVLIDGKGFRKGAVQWLKEAAEKRKYCFGEHAEKRVRVLNSTEFLTWCNEIFR